MANLRIADRETVSSIAVCSRCRKPNRRWDRIAGEALCPNCQELLVQGFGAPLVLKTEKHQCAVCSHKGTVCYLTFPLQASDPVEMDLCPRHLRAMLGRFLDPDAFGLLRQMLADVGLEVDDIFLLHHLFYDTMGQAELPAVES